MSIKFQNKKIGKKGIFFTIVSISLLTLILYSFAIYEYDLSDKSSVIQTRVETMNGFMKDIDSDIERGFYISAYRSVLGMQQYIIDNGTFMSDAESQFVEVFENGTINETYLIITKDNLFSDWIFKTWQKGHTIGIDVNITVDDVRLYQDNPWQVKADLSATMIIQDSKKTSSWKKSKTYTAIIGIEGFEDPLYVYNLDMKASNLIYKSPYENNYTLGSNVSNLQKHLDGNGVLLVGSYYTNSSLGPGFLDRLEGRTSLHRTGTGIESMLNKDKLSSVLGAQDAEYYYNSAKSSFDYVQFGPSSHATFNVSGMPSWFRIDNSSGHLEKYGVSSLAQQN